MVLVGTCPCTGRNESGLLLLLLLLLFCCCLLVVVQLCLFSFPKKDRASPGEKSSKSYLALEKVTPSLSWWIFVLAVVVGSVWLLLNCN